MSDRHNLQRAVRIFYVGAAAFSLAYLLIFAVSSVWLRHAGFFHLAPPSRDAVVRIHSALMVSPAGGIVLDALALFWSMSICGFLILFLLRRRQFLSDLRGPKSPPPAPHIIRSAPVVRRGHDRGAKVLQFRRR